jgi:hypothetical protein
MAVRPNQVVTSTTPPAVNIMCKTVQVARTDTVAFDAFTLPAGAVLAGVYVMGVTNSDATTTAVIHLGSNPGTTNEVLTSFSVKSTTGQGYHQAGVAAGTKIGVQVTADTLIQAKYVGVGAESTGGPWVVKAEYYFPQSGFTF